MNDELKMAFIQEGKSAMFVLRHIEPLIERRIKYTIGEMKQLFSTGTLTESRAQALTAKLVSYDEIISALNAQMNVGVDAGANNPDNFIHPGEMQDG